jgi:predicted amidophosphoribosyltransferase
MKATIAQQLATKKWISNNREFWNERCKKANNIYYQNHKEERKKNVSSRYRFKKEVERLMNMVNQLL